MTARATYPPTLQPLEQYAAQYDELFVSPQQQQRFREYLTGLLEPRQRNKTLTALAGAEPVVQANHAAVQRLQYFLSESPWDAEKINDRRVQLLMADPVTRPHEQGVLVVDDTGHRKDGHATAHVARQYLGSVGKTDNGIVVVSTLWADEKVYYPLHLAPYTPAELLPDCEHNPDFATKAQLAVRLATRARQGGVPFAAVVADCWYGDNQRFTRDLDTAGLPFVMGLKPHVKRKRRRKSRREGEQDATARLVEVAKALPWDGPDNPGPWEPVTRRFRDGGAATWWAAEVSFGQWGPDEAVRLVVATADPGRLPPHNTWFLLTNRPRPGGPRQAHSRYPSADLTEVVRCYGLRNWVEQGYKQVKQELGWADFQVRCATAIRRHLILVCTAFSFCWRDWFIRPPPDVDPPQPSGDRGDRPGKGNRPTQQCTVDEQVASGPGQETTAPHWPQTLRRVRAWLSVATTLTRIWRGWSDEPPPAPLQALLSAAAAGQPIYTYLALPP